MDFNTGSGGEAGAGGSSGGPGVPSPPRVSGGAAGGDFGYRELVPSFIRMAREVLLNPVNFFKSIRREGDFLNPLLFAVICALISAVIGGILAFIISLATGNGFGGSLGSLVSNIILIPIGTAIGLFIGAAIYHLLVLLIIRRSHAGYEATFRVVAYAAVLQLLSWLAYIPILGIPGHPGGDRDRHLQRRVDRDRYSRGARHDHRTGCRRGADTGDRRSYPDICRRSRHSGHTGRRVQLCPVADAAPAPRD